MLKDCVRKGIDIMKKTKDAVNSQPSDTDLLNLITALKETGCTHICIAVPINSNAQFVAAGTTPSPRTIEAFYSKVCDTIHDAGLSVLHRGTLCELEGIWGFTHAVGSNRIAAGTASSASTDGTTTLLGRIYTHVDRMLTNGDILSGDELGFCPERTEGIFSDSTAFLPTTGGLQTNFANFFNDLRTVCLDLLTAHSVTGVTAGMTANNYSEVRSGWIPGSVFTTAESVCADYYGNYSGDGNYSPQRYYDDIQNVAQSKGELVDWQEWGDIVNNFKYGTDQLNYLIRLYKKMSQLQDDGYLNRFNYWGGWEAQDTSILIKNGDGTYSLNADGKILSAFYKGGGMSRVPVLNSDGTF